MSDIPVAFLASLAKYLMKENFVNSTTVVDTATNTISLLTKQILASKKNYEEQIVPNDSSPIRKKREELISQLSLLQNEILITVSDTKFLARVLPMLLEQIIPLYKVKTEEELGVIGLSLDQIRGYLEQYKKLVEERKKARRYAISVSAFVVVGLIAFIIWSSFGGPKTNTIIPLLEIPLPILLWSTIGSFTAILYRFNNSGDIELHDPMRWLFTRPLTGIVMGIVTYYVFTLGLTTVSSEAIDTTKSPVIFWVVAFLSSFSDRFMDSLLHSLVGKFGGNANDPLVSLDTTSTGGSQIFKRLTDLFPTPKPQEPKKPRKPRQKKQDKEASTTTK